MDIPIALAGNPNCGKTTLFNHLTGSNQYVGNWPGVTVEKTSGRLKGYKDVIVQDLPGIYSLSPYSPEEVVTRAYLVNEHPDAILNIVDGTNIERNLYLTTQLIELGHPVVVAVNMIDLVRRTGDEIDLERLGRALGCVVMEISALKGEGCAEAAAKAVELARNHSHGEMPHVFNGSVEHALAHIEESIEGKVQGNYLRWYAIKVFERDEHVLRELDLDEELLSHLEKHIADCEWELDDDAESIIADQRYRYITDVVGRTVKKKRAKHGLTLSGHIDRIVTNRILALPIFAGIMYLMYAIAMGNYPFSIGTMGTNWANDVLFGDGGIIPGFLDRILTALSVSGWLRDLVMDGIVAGVGSVLGFVPQILVLSLLLSLLEDVGYMSRVAFIMDRALRKFGLSGKSIIPMLVATGCGVPGILASRTIERECDRKITVITTGFIPCGAKMPIIALFAGALFGNSPLVAVSAFLIGILAVVLSGVILKKFKPLAGEAAPFVMELPEYHLPSLRNVGRTTLERGWDFVRRATTIILLSSIVLWFLQGYGFANGTFGPVSENDSLLSTMGKLLEWIFVPLGWGNWKAVVATLTGLVAKEQVVNTFGVLYAGGDVSGAFTGLSAYSFMIFNLLCAPCFAAMGAIRQEMRSGKWTAFAIGYMCAFAYAVSLIVYQFGALIAGGAFGVGTVAAIVVLGALLWLLLRKGHKVCKVEHPDSAPVGK